MYVSLNELRHRVKILRPITEEDGAVNLIRTDEEEVSVVWAKVLPYAAKISDGYMEKVDEVKYRIVIRWRDDVEVTDEIAWRSHRFIQTAPAYDLRSNRQYLVFEVREDVEDGHKMRVWREFLAFFDRDKGEMPIDDFLSAHVDLIVLAFGKPEVTKEAVEDSLEICEVIPFTRDLFRWLQSQTFAKLVNLPNANAGMECISTSFKRPSRR